MHLRILAVLSTLLLAGLAASQTIPMHIQRPISPNMANAARAGTTTAPLTANQLNYEDPDMMKAQIARLKKDKRDLRQQLQLSLSDLQALRVQLDEMTKPGGSGVTARCAGPELSTNTAGESENCAASGYACASVSGLCHRECRTSDMCAGGFVCDTGAGRCVSATAYASDE
jgi:hypothetical protein